MTRAGAAARRPATEVLDDDSQGFDPTRVPVFPVVRVALRNAAGRVEGSVEGQVVVLGTLDQAREGVVQAVAVLAADRGGRVAAIRAHGTAFEGPGWDFVVTADGRAFDAPSVRDAAATAGQRPRVGRRARWVLLTPVVVAVVLACVAVVGVVRSPGTGAGAAATRTTPTPVATQLPVAMPAGWSSQAVWSAPVASSATSAAVTLAADGQRVFAPGPPAGSGSAGVAGVSGVSGTSVAAYEARTGALVWSQPVNQPLQAGPALVLVEGRAAVVASTAGRLFAWDPATGAVVGSWPLPSTGGGVLLTATGPVVRRDRAHADVLVAGQLATRVIPAGAVIVAPGREGSLLMTAPSGSALVGAAAAAAASGRSGGQFGDPTSGAGRVWSVVSPLVAPSPAVLAAPAGTTYLQTVGWTGDVLVAAFQTAPGTGTVRTGSGAQAVVLRAFSVGAAGQWQPRWTTTAIPPPTTLSTSGSGWVTSPSGSWAVFGSTVIRLATGGVVALPADWRSAGLGDTFGFGTTGGAVAVVTPAGVRSDPGPDTTTATAASTATPSPSPPLSLSIGAGAGGAVVPVSAPGAVSGDTAFLIASDGDANHLYAVTGGTGVTGVTGAAAGAAGVR